MDFVLSWEHFLDIFFDKEIIILVCISSENRGT